mmetsp:Transcript_19382/g.35109  ORF Transcript_19382/g.35109 Transcript_19382/m.35109 type:complete len:82 (-) Transcript_19382:74-319(-)
MENDCAFFHGTVSTTDRINGRLRDGMFGEEVSLIHLKSRPLSNRRTDEFWCCQMITATPGYYDSFFIACRVAEARKEDDIV